MNSEARRPKHNEETLKTSAGETASGGATKTHIECKKKWLYIALTWVFTVAIQAITTLLVTGYVGLIIGIVLSAIPFFIGIRAITREITKEHYHL